MVFIYNLNIKRMTKIKKIFNSKNLKVALIVTTGRTGSDYLNCCLDNLRGVMTFCGKFNYHQFFETYEPYSSFLHDHTPTSYTSPYLF